MSVGICGVKALFWVTQALCKLKKVRSRAQRGGDIDASQEQSGRGRGQEPLKERNESRHTDAEPWLREDGHLMWQPLSTRLRRSKPCTHARTHALVESIRCGHCVTEGRAKASNLCLNNFRIDPVSEIRQNGRTAPASALIILYHIVGA